MRGPRTGGKKPLLTGARQMLALAQLAVADGERTPLTQLAGVRWLHTRKHCRMLPTTPSRASGQISAKPAVSALA